jgi:hypothetical protein
MVQFHEPLDQGSRIYCLNKHCCFVSILHQKLPYFKEKCVGILIWEKGAQATASITSFNAILLMSCEASGWAKPEGLLTKDRLQYSYHASQVLACKTAPGNSNLSFQIKQAAIEFHRPCMLGIHLCCCGVRGLPSVNGLHRH